MEPEEILEKTRELIRDCAGQDQDRLFYVNRYVFARLQLDERKVKTTVKSHLLDANQPCYLCSKSFKSRVGIHLHRLDGTRGYSDDNCVLMHPECHTRYHCEHPEQQHRRGRRKRTIGRSPDAVLPKQSKRYDGHNFVYWWDISPKIAEHLDKYDAVEFIKKDTGESCSLPPAALKGFFITERQTSRGNGNWGIRVLRDHEDKLAFEPGTGGGDWTFLPVVWLAGAED